MADNVIRTDVIELLFDSNTEVFSSVNDIISDIADNFNSLSENDSLDNITQDMAGLRTAADNTTDGIQDIISSIDDISNVSSINDITQDINQLNSTTNSSANRFTTLKNNIINSLTKGERGVKGFTNSLKSIGNMSLSGLGKGLSFISDSMKNLIPQAKEFAVNIGKGVGKLAGKAVKSAAIGLTAATTAISGGVAASVFTGSNFEAGMSQVAATMGITQADENYKILSDTAKEMGKSTKFSATQSAEALNYLALAGYEANEACSALPTVLNLASAGGMDLAYASDMITDSMSALGLSQNQLEAFGDSMAKTSQKSNTNVSQLGEAILTVGGSAKDLAGGYTEMNTVLGIFANNGVKGSEGGTALRNIMQRLQSPTDEAAAKMEALGLSVFDAQGKMRPMNDIFTDLDKSMQGFTDEAKSDVITTIFNTTDKKSAIALLDNCGESYDELFKQIDNCDGAMSNMADTMNDNLTGRVTEFKSAVEGVQIAIFESLGSSNLKDLVQEASGWMSELTQATENGGLAGLAEAFGDIFSKALIRVSEILPEAINIGTSIITSLISGLLKNMPKITDGAVKTATAFINGLVSIIPQLLLAGLDMIDSLGQGISKSLPLLLTTASKALSNLLKGLTDKLPDLFATGMDIIQTLVDGILEQMPSLVFSALDAILAFIEGLAQTLPQIFLMGCQLLTVFAQSIISYIPTLLPIASRIINTLIQGIVDMIPDLIQLAIDLIISFCDTALNNLDIIIKVGLEITFAVLAGIVKAIPALLDIIPKLIGALVDIILNTDWLDVGKKVIKGFIDGLVNGLKFFSKDTKKDSGELAKSFSDGVVSNSSVAFDAGKEISISAEDGLKADANTISNYGTQTVGYFANSISSSKDLIQNSVAEVSGTIENDMHNINLSSSGAQMMDSFSSGIESQKDSVISNVKEIADQSQSVVTELSSNIESNSASVCNASQHIASCAASSLEVDENIVSENGCKAIETFSDSISKSEDLVKNAALKISKSVTDIFDKIDLTDKGIEIMKGFNKGLASQKIALMLTLKSIVNSMKSITNTPILIDIQKREIPSSIANDAPITKHADGGLMTSKHTGIVAEAGAEMIIPLSYSKRKRGIDLWQQTGDLLGINPKQEQTQNTIKYNPESDNKTYNYNNSNTTENNTYSPVLNLEINGTNLSTRELKGLIKQSFKEFAQETNESFLRRNPRLTKV